MKEEFDESIYELLEIRKEEERQMKIRLDIDYQVQLDNNRKRNKAQKYVDDKVEECSFGFEAAFSFDVDAMMTQLIELSGYGEFAEIGKTEMRSGVIAQVMEKEMLISSKIEEAEELDIERVKNYDMGSMMEWNEKVLEGQIPKDIPVLSYHVLPSHREATGAQTHALLRRVADRGVSFLDPTVSMEVFSDKESVRYYKSSENGVVNNDLDKERVYFTLGMTMDRLREYTRQGIKILGLINSPYYPWTHGNLLGIEERGNVIDIRIRMNYREYRERYYKKLEEGEFRYSQIQWTQWLRISISKLGQKYSGMEMISNYSIDDIQLNTKKKVMLMTSDIIVDSRGLDMDKSKVYVPVLGRHVEYENVPMRIEEVDQVRQIGDWTVTGYVNDELVVIAVNVGIPVSPPFYKRGDKYYRAQYDRGRKEMCLFQSPVYMEMTNWENSIVEGISGLPMSSYGKILDNSVKRNRSINLGFRGALFSLDDNKDLYGQLIIDDVDNNGCGSDVDDWKC